LLTLAVAVVTLYVGRSYMARYIPGIPAYYSAIGELFTYENVYLSGPIHPFTLGQSRADVLAIIKSAGSDDLVEAPMVESTNTTEFRHPSSLSVVDVEKLNESTEWRYASRSAGARTVYELSFEDEALAKVTLTATLVS
jgi:hypothetical protein